MTPKVPKFFPFLIILCLFLTDRLFAQMPLPFPEDLREISAASEVIPSSDSEIESDLPPKEIKEDESKIAEKLPEDREDRTVKEKHPEPEKPKRTLPPNLTEKKGKKGGKREGGDSGKAAYERGLFRLRNGQKEAAQEEFSKAAAGGGEMSGKAKLELSKFSGSGEQPQTSEGQDEEIKWKSLLESARTLRSQSKYPEAESALLQVATEAPDEFRAQAYLQLGDSLFRQGKYKEARSYLIDFWNRFGKKYPIGDDVRSAEFKRQREERDLGAYLLFKASYKSGETEWAKKFLSKYLEKSSKDVESKFSPMRSELENFARRE
ncbi:tetratricopeptide repeat protein [Leptospira fluminis]|uniref:Tetratricopeptide repeat protein n=2 Tax=Leptospira fluminis TaxID=2484979 RepID=A0A4R9GNM2_9LEPT|nr:tetratricopeptide repeat protein [Leptospira fluminis]